MQPKVSMVIPCYNKVNYIAGMLDSVLAQKWDNVELVLVNDGSTDGTREVIEQYTSQIKTRGYELVIIDQENQGVAGAVYEGLKRVSGDFVCQVDADDELDPEYISMMAGWLTVHPEYEWAACDMLFIEPSSTYVLRSFPQGTELDIESFILSKLSTSVCYYLVRTSYLNFCNVLKHYYHESKITQEPQFCLPLIIGKGKIKYFQLPLYKAIYRQMEGHLVYCADLGESIDYHTKFQISIQETIKWLPLSENGKKRLYVLSELERIIRILSYAVSNNTDINTETNRNNFLLEYVDMVNTCFYPSPECGENETFDFLFIRAMEDCILNIKPISNLDSLRVIAWGVLGVRARKILPLLKNTPLEPTEFWDMAGDGVTIKKPNPNDLTANDMLLILPAGAAGNEIHDMLKGHIYNILSYYEIFTYIASLKYPQFYDGSVKFMPKEVTQ